MQNAVTIVKPSVYAVDMNINYTMDANGNVSKQQYMLKNISNENISPYSSPKHLTYTNHAVK